MELRQLEIFAEVARRASFTQAARTLGIAQPAVSQSIARLEQELRVLLFTRTGRSIQLTEAGRHLKAHAERVLIDVAAAYQDIALLRGIAAGRLIVGTTPTIATHLLPRVLATYREQCPYVEVVLREAGASTLMAMLERGVIDLGIGVLPVAHPDLLVEPLFTEPLMLAVAASAPIARLAGGQPVSLRMAANEPFILYRASYHLRSATLSGCRAVGFEPRIALEGGEMETVLRMVAAGLGVSIVPQLAFEGVPRPGVVAVPINEPVLARTMAIMRRQDRPVLPAAEAFMAILQEIQEQVAKAPLDTTLL